MKTYKLEVSHIDLPAHFASYWLNDDVSGLTRPYACLSDSDSSYQSNGLKEKHHA